MRDTSTPAPAIEPVAEVLRAAGLRYSRDGDRGWRRVGRPGSFRYVDADGRALRDAEALARVRRLVLPPAWTDVWICADANGHLQATGRDVRGRKQYRYHDDWRHARDHNKFSRLTQFGRALPAIRAAVARDLGEPGLPREKVLAAMVRLLDRTYVRVGDERYRKENGSFGLSTLRSRHVEVAGDRIRLRFRGKAGKEHDVSLSDKRLARILKHCLDLPGYELFQYVDDGETRRVCATDVNDYLREISGTDYTAKDFRTWGATMIALDALVGSERPASNAAVQREVNAALRSAAAVLGNTLAVCRKSYVHPGVAAAFLDGSIGAVRMKRCKGLRMAERKLLGLLERIGARGTTRERRANSRGGRAATPLRARAMRSDARRPQPARAVATS
jgi:DNA topoisomerase-1